MAWPSAKGILDRAHDVVTGAWGGAQAPFGLGLDLMRAPLTEDDLAGILGTMRDSVQARAGQLLGNLASPDEGLGAAIGGAPEVLRQPVRTAFEGLETLYREGVAEPLATAHTAGQLATSDEFLEEEGREDTPIGRFGALLDADTWRAAHGIAQSRSHGQAAALGFGVKDILDEEEVERFVGTTFYKVTSGTLDALGRIFLEPDIGIAKLMSVRRAGRAVTGGARLGRVAAVTPPQVGRRAEQVGDLGPRVTAINEAIDRAYHRLPDVVQRRVASERTFQPEDIARLERFERTAREVRTRGLDAEARYATDPTRVRVLQNVAESRRAREARIGAGATVEGTEVGGFRRQIAEAREDDIETYLAAADSPQPKGTWSRLTRTPGWRAVDELIDTFPADVDTRAGLIRDRLFPTHHRGDTISRYLAEAQGPAERTAVMRVFLGDMNALDDLSQSSYALAKRLEDLSFQQAVILAEPAMVLGGTRARPSGQLTLGSAFDDVTMSEGRLARIGEEIDAVVPEVERIERLRGAWKTLPEGPTYGRRAALRHGVKSSHFYQQSLLGRGLRVVSDMRPHHLVDSHDARADAMLARMLREAGYDDDAIARARGQFVAKPIEARGFAFERWVERAERKVLGDHGLDTDEIEAVIHEARLGKHQANAMLRKPKFDAEGRARVQFRDGDEFVEVEMPLSVTQMQNAVSVPNLHLLRKHAARYARLKHGDNWRAQVARGAKPAWTAKEYGLDAMRGIMDVWRPGVLLRPAWTMRVVGDEQLRMIAKFGALSVALGERGRLTDYMAELKRNPVFKRVLRTDGVASPRLRGTAIGGVGGGVVAGPLGMVAGGAVGNRIVRRMAEAERRGVRNIRFGGHSISGPFGDPGSKAEIYRVLNSASRNADELFGVHEARFFGALRRDPTRWRTYTWGESAQVDAVYRQEWVRNLRHQIAQDEMGRQLLAGKNVDEVVDWMDNTLAGRRYASLIPGRTDHVAWVEAYADQVNRYTGGVEELRHRVLGLADDATDAKAAELLDLIPESARAPIHGAETDALNPRSPITQAVNGFVEQSFDVLGTMPTDALSRNPTFARFYAAEVRRLFADIEPGRLPETMIRRLEGSARDFALRETRELLYDLAEQSRFGSMVRMLMPFFPAYQEVLTRWAGLAWENPAFAARARQMWQAPDRMGWTYTDDRGNDFLRLRIPEFARDLVDQGIFRSALDSQGYIHLDKGGFNLAAQGTPGFGPFVQIAVSDAVKANPSVEDAARFIIPFGPVGPEALIPPVVRRFQDARGEEGAARANAEGRILTTKLAQMENGDIPRVDFSDPAARQEFLDEVDRETAAFMRLRVFSGFVAPVSPLYESPYKGHIEVYRALRDGDWERARQVGAEFDVPGAEGLPRSMPADTTTTADDIFLDTFGEEFFALTQSFTETLDGVPPTVEGLEASEQYGDLIAAYPEWGGVIAGYDGGGQAVQFSRAVYDRQFAAGSRRRLTPDEVLDAPEKRLGWAHYSRYMDLVEGLRVSRGLPNLQVAEAEDLRQVKRFAIDALASKYPAWYDEFSITDRNRWAKRLEGARRMVADPDLARRPDIGGLADYLHIRDQVLVLLSTRESTSLDAVSNMDVAQLWSSAVAALVERNPAFADLWYRKLERDPLDVSTAPATLAA